MNDELHIPYDVQLQRAPSLSVPCSFLAIKVYSYGGLVQPCLAEICARCLWSIALYMTSCFCPRVGRIAHSLHTVFMTDHDGMMTPLQYQGVSRSTLAGITSYSTQCAQNLLTSVTRSNLEKRWAWRTEFPLNQHVMWRARAMTATVISQTICICMIQLLLLGSQCAKYRRACVRDERRCCTGVPSHAAYQLLGQDNSCEEQTGGPDDMNGAHRLFTSDMPSTQAEDQADYGTHETTGHAQSLSAAVDPQSAQAQAVHCQMPNDNDLGEHHSPVHALPCCRALLYSTFSSTIPAPQATCGASCFPGNQHARRRAEVLHLSGQLSPCAPMPCTPLQVENPFLRASLLGLWQRQPEPSAQDASQSTLHSGRALAQVLL